MAWLAYAASSAFISSVFGEYVHRLGLLPQVSTHVLACGLIVSCAALNWIGTRVSGASQSVASALKGAFFVALILILFASPRGPATPAHATAAVTGVGAAIMAIRLIYQTYAGWDSAIYFSEEVHRPDRNVARATFAGIGLCAVIYVLVNAAALHVLPPAAMAGSALAVGDAAKVSMGAFADTALTLFGLFSLAAIVNLQTMVATRVTFRMARDGALPTLLGKVSPGGTPRRSLALLVVVSLLFAATGGYESIVKIYAPWTIGGILIICLASIRLRYAEPDLVRPWRMPLFPWTAILASLMQASLIAVFAWDDPVDGLFSAVAVVAPIPIYLLLRRRWEASAEREFGLALR
jgi:APA family basic amino acid/polyamine antiporter